MALRLSELQSRVKSKGHHKRKPMPAMPPRVRPHSAPMAAGGTDLKSQLIAKGASPEEAERITNLVAQADAASAMGYGRALSTPVPLPRVTEASDAAQSAILGALGYTSVGLILEGIFALCDEFDIAISLGVGYLAGVGGGGGQTVGIVFGPNRTVGYFSSVGQVVGWIISVSGSIAFSVVKGGLPSFNGQSVTIGGTVGAENPGEPVSPGAGVHNIYNTNGDWIGMTGEVSLSAGVSPVEFFRGEWTTRSNTTTVPSLSVPAYHRRSMAQESMNPIVVDARYRAFIPSPAIALSLPVVGMVLKAFSGDGRSFSYDRGTHRLQVDADLQMRSHYFKSEIRDSSAHWGLSKEYDTSDVISVAGKPDWWYDVKPGATAIDQATLPRTPDNLGIVIGGQGTRDAVYGAVSTDSMFSFHADGGLPLLPDAGPNINARIRLLLRNNNNQIEAKCEGQHDGFPAHEVYVAGKRVYGYDPVAAGNTPTSLGGLLDGEISVNTPWVHIGAAGEVKNRWYQRQQATGAAL